MALTSKLKARFTKARTHIQKLCYENGMLDEYHYFGAGAPTDGTSGTYAGVAGTGATYHDTTNAKLYINTNTLASPTWSVVGAQTT